MQKNSLALKSVKFLTAAAMLTAMSVVIGIFCKTFLNFSMGLFRITFENTPIIMAGILLGPTAGGLVGGASDFISYLLSGQSYPMNFVVTAGAVSIGVISGMVSHYVIKKRSSVQILLSGLSAHAVGSMIIKSIGLYQIYGIMVLWRVPTYLIIAPIEVFIICKLFKRDSIKRLFDPFGAKSKK